MAKQNVVNITLPHGYTPRPYQLPILRALDNGKKRAVWVAHRRSGKDITIFNWCIKTLMSGPAMTCFYVADTYAHAKKILWDNITTEGKRMLDHVPPQIIESLNQQEMKIRFINGSLLQLVGSDNIDSLVGTNPKIIVFTEYALQSPEAWTLLRPILAVNGGWSIFISTPRGKNHFYETLQIAKDNPLDWFWEVLSIEDTGVLSSVDMDRERREGMSEELIQQEYYCSFDRGIEGSFYGKLVEVMKKEGRVGRVLDEKRSPVNTAWDIGFGDSTSIVFWQVVGSEVRVIDFYEAQGEGTPHYAKVLQDRGYVYGGHYFPHDAGSGSIQTGKTLQNVAREHGIEAYVLKRDDLSVGIEAVRSLLSVCYIDAEKCRVLLKCLEGYHKRFNEKMGVYSQTPVHDVHSHGADAMRYMAMARRDNYGGSSGKGLTPEMIREMRQKYLGY